MDNRFFSPSSLVFKLFIALMPYWCGAQSVIDVLPPVDSLTDVQVSDISRQLATQAGEFEQILTSRSQNATDIRIQVEEHLKMAQMDSTSGKPTLDSLATLLKSVKSFEKNSLKQLQKASKTREFASKTAESDSLTQRKNLGKVWKEVQGIQQLVAPQPAPEIAKSDPMPPVKKKEKKKKEEIAETNAPVVQPPAGVNEEKAGENRHPEPPKRAYKKYDPAADVMLHPPALPCAFQVKTRDEFSGEIYRKTAAVELFRHSPAALKGYLQGKANVVCEAALAAAGQNTSLHLTFIINDPSPRKAFGKLDKNAMATLWFMDGSSFMLYNQVASEGALNPDNQLFIYQGQFSVPAEVFRKMSRTELDKIRIAWSSGYEDYDVQFVQLLMQQAKCLSE